MQGEASRLADRESRDSFAAKLRESGNDAWEIGNELFTITYVFDHNPRIPRALTDPGRPTEDKVALLNNLLGKQALPLTMEILTDLVGRSWSRAGDIDNAIEDFAVDAMMYQADDEKKTLKVSVQLAQPRAPERPLRTAACTHRWCGFRPHHRASRRALHTQPA